SIAGRLLLLAVRSHAFHARRARRRQLRQRLQRRQGPLLDSGRRRERLRRALGRPRRRGQHTFAAALLTLSPAHGRDAVSEPKLPENAWDPYAMEWGYAYRGQPSIVFAVDFALGPKAGTLSTATPEGRSSWQVWDSGYGELESATDRADAPDGLANTGGSGID